MSAVNAPFGFKPVRTFDGRLPQYEIREGGIPSGFGEDIFSNQPVELQTDGTIQPVTAGTQEVYGIFAGVEYTDATGAVRVSANWVSGTALADNTQALARVYIDDDTIYEVQADGSIPLSGVGDQADASNFGAGSNTTGLSQSTLSSTLKGTGVQGQFRILDKSPAVDNAFGDAFTIVRVQIARHPFVAPQPAV